MVAESFISLLQCLQLLRQIHHPWIPTVNARNLRLTLYLVISLGETLCLALPRQQIACLVVLISSSNGNVISHLPSSTRTPWPAPQRRKRRRQCSFTNPLPRQASFRHQGIAMLRDWRQASTLGPPIAGRLAFCSQGGYRKDTCLFEV